MNNGSRYDPPTRELIERIVEQQDQLYGFYSDLHGDVRTIMVEVYGEGTTVGLKTTVGKLQIAAGVSKKWAASVTALVSSIVVAVGIAIKTVLFEN